MTVSELVCVLHSWQDLLGAVIGALVGGVMGFWGANIVARDQSQRERRSAVRTLILDLVSFKKFADLLVEDVAPPPHSVSHSPVAVVHSLQGYCYSISPMFDSAITVIFGGVDSALSRQLTIFVSAYRELQERISKASDPAHASPMSLVVTTFQRAHAAANAALEYLTPEYAEMFVRPPKWWSPRRWSFKRRTSK